MSRGVRGLLIGLLALVLPVIPAAPAVAASIVVTATTDAADPVPGDGICRSVSPADTTSSKLRAAIDTANANPDTDVITFASGVTTIAANGSTTRTITAPVTIDGGSTRVRVEGPGISLSSLIPGLWIRSSNVTVN